MSQLKAGEVFSFANLVPYKKGEAVKQMLVNTDDFKLLAISVFEGTLAAHPAPLNAIVTAIEGEGVITYEGKSSPIKAGESFIFDKGALHSVSSDTQLKFILTLTSAAL